jgi:hypothetical protein
LQKVEEYLTEEDVFYYTIQKKDDYHFHLRFYEQLLTKRWQVKQNEELFQKIIDSEPKFNNIKKLPLHVRYVLADYPKYFPVDSNFQSKLEEMKRFEFLKNIQYFIDSFNISLKMNNSNLSKKSKIQLKYLSKILIILIQI